MAAASSEVSGGRLEAAVDELMSRFVSARSAVGEHLYEDTEYMDFVYQVAVDTIKPKSKAAHVVLERVFDDDPPLAHPPPLADMTLFSKRGLPAVPLSPLFVTLYG